MSKFKIPKIPPTTSKSIRFPNDIIEKIEKAIQGKQCTVALESLEEEQTPQDGPEA